MPGAVKGGHNKLCLTPEGIACRQAKGRRNKSKFSDYLEGNDRHVKLFTYGTLSRRHRLEALLGRRLADPEPAVLPGYARYSTPRGYPIVLPREGNQVEGLAWDVEEDELSYVDHYEGMDEVPPFYRRVRVTIVIDDKETQALVYEGNPAIYWDIERD